MGNTNTLSDNQSLAVAGQILEQLGGQRFIAMTGARNLVGGGESLSFRVGRNDRGVTHVRITLEPCDLYRCEFLKIRGTRPPQTLADVPNVFADQLRDVFTAQTGLETSLGTMGRA